MADPIAAALDKATTPDVDGKRMIVNVAVSALSLKTGETYSHASGVTSLFPNSNDAEAAKPMALDSVCFIASCTKLMTTVAALQCVEQGLVALDDDLAEKMEELKDIQILKGFDDRGEPILEKAKNKVTLRLLLTHSSGFSYDVSHPLLLQWRKWRGEAPGTLSGSFAKGYVHPLVFEPGEGWTYGGGIDWAGKLVERLNGGQRLGEYMKTHIWDPLGMKDTTFDITSRPDMMERMVSMSARLEDGTIVPIPLPYVSPPDDDLGGVGCYSTANDYVKLLTSLLKRDGKLLKSETIEQMFQPHLPEGGKFLSQQLQDPLMRQGLAGNFDEGTKLNWGLGGMINESPLASTGRKGGSMQWGGMPNLIWWIDPEAGVCGTYFGQLMPPGDRTSQILFSEFEKGFYALGKRA